MLLLLHFQMEGLNTRESGTEVKKYFLQNTVPVAFGMVSLRCKKVKLGGAEIYQIKIQLILIHRTVTEQFLAHLKIHPNGKNGQYG